MSASVQANTPKRELSRHITADGRNSLRKHLFGPREQSLSKNWISTITKRGALPLIAAVAGGMVLAVGFGIRHLAYSPDVRVNKVKRQQTIRENHDEGKNWVKHRDSLRNVAGYVEKPKTS